MNTEQSSKQQAPKATDVWETGLTHTTSSAMTISYSDNFLRILARWKGSAWKAVWKELLIWLALYYSVRAALELAVTCEDNKKTVKAVIGLFEQFTSKIPLEFLLGFYVGQVVTRWWQQVQHVPWPDEVVAWACMVFPDEGSKLKRHTIARYLILSQTLALRMISTRIRKRFPTEEHLVKADLMTEEELALYKACPCPNVRWQLPLQWVINGIIAPCSGQEAGKLPIMAITPLVNLINNFRTNLRQLMVFDWICIPLVYTQTVSVVVYGYFLMCLLGHQTYGKETELYVPVLTILQFVFYVGWLKVAQDLMRPFGEDDDDVELNSLLDRHFSVAIAMANHVCAKNPSFAGDNVFHTLQKFDDAVNVDLPYTKTSLKHSADQPPKLHARVNEKYIDDMEMVYKKDVRRHRLQKATAEDDSEKGDASTSNAGNAKSFAHCMKRLAAKTLRGHQRENIYF